MAIGSNPAETERRAYVIGSDSIRTNALIGTPAMLTERIAELGGLGVDTVYLHIYDIHDLDHIALIGAEVLPHVTAMKVATP